MEKRKLFVLENVIWRASDWLDTERSSDPISCEMFLFKTKEECEKKASEIEADEEVYNECTIYQGSLSDEEILDITGFDSIEDFEEALSETYSTNPSVRNFGEFEKCEVAREIRENATSEDTFEVKCANYDFNRSLEGAILVFWSWERYIGYARRFKFIRIATSDDKTAMLTKEDRVFATQCDVLLTKEEAAEAEENGHWEESVRERLDDSSWKWCNATSTELRF